ncbi:aminoglycoside phosphotransferase family protein [Bacillus sp. FSL K6-3431]|uniref:aminoglycoside phosphotransferase family protein n=1 Tax=Bacillus sp. FSL K6-3431 TaxID=2921500 RepID=UPI0030F89BD1
MKTDNSLIDTSKLLACINDTFTIGDMSLIRFIPKGEEGYCYYIEGEAGECYFVKALHIQPHLEEALTMIQRLNGDHGKSYILPPLKTRKGKCSVLFDSYQISIYPFVHGESLYECEITKENRSYLAKIMADFHSIDTNTFKKLPRETFNNPFEKNILHLLAMAKNGKCDTTHYKQSVRDLLIQETDEIQATLTKMRSMQKELLTLPMQTAITHGDPNYANIMRDLQGELYLIDFADIGIGPVERDLMAFVEDNHFGSFLSIYVKDRPQTKLHIEIFEFYLYRWCLQEISDYSSQILEGRTGEVENEHAWMELQAYLPIPHAEMMQRLWKIDEDIKSF